MIEMRTELSKDLVYNDEILNHIEKRSHRDQCDNSRCLCGQSQGAWAASVDMVTTLNVHAAGLLEISCPGECAWRMLFWWLSSAAWLAHHAKETYWTHSSPQDDFTQISGFVGGVVEPRMMAGCSTPPDTELQHI